MVKKEFYKEREDGVKLYRSYSDRDVMIKQDQTGNEYAEAIDVENASYTYTETDIPVEGGDDMDEQRLREIENRLDQHDEDIEANAEGIQELAEIIGGGE